METEWKKVEGSTSLYKNIDTGTVINTNDQEIFLARKRKEIRKQEKEKQIRLENELDSMKETVSDLTKLVKELVGKQNARV